MDDHLVTSASHSSHSGVIGGVIAGIVAIILAVVGFTLAKKRNLMKKTVSNNGVAFENPTYVSSIHMDRVQVSYNLTLVRNQMSHKILSNFFRKLIPRKTGSPSSTSSSFKCTSLTVFLLQITSNSASSNGSDYKQEELHAPAASIQAETEVNPTLIEELKLGSSNAGFKKLVS